MKTAVVKEVAPFGEPRQGQYGMMYTYAVKFENGDSGLYTSTSENQNKFIKGEQAHYIDEAKQSQSGKTWYKIKPANPQYDAPAGTTAPTSSGGGAVMSKDVLIVRQTALKAAAEFGTSIDCKTSDVLKMAELFAQWVLNEKKEEVAAPVAAAPVAVADDGLPF